MKDEVTDVHYICWTIWPFDYFLPLLSWALGMPILRGYRAPFALFTVIRFQLPLNLNIFCGNGFFLVNFVFLMYGRV